VISITFQHKPGTKRLLILVEEEEWKEVDISIFGSRPSFPKFHSLTELEEFFLQLEYRGAKSFAYKRLSIKPLSTAELRRQLKERKVSEKNTDAVIQELTNLGYLNDEEWIESFIRSQSNRQKGPQAVAAKLKWKGLKEEEFQEPLQEMMDDEVQKEGIQKLLSTRYRSKDLQDRRERDKVIAALVRRGYSLDVIFSVFNHI
jgi:regulatory protein